MATVNEKRSTRNMGFCENVMQIVCMCFYFPSIKLALAFMIKIVPSSQTASRAINRRQWSLTVNGLHFDYISLKQCMHLQVQIKKSFANTMKKIVSSLSSNMPLTWLHIDKLIEFIILFICLKQKKNASFFSRKRKESNIQRLRNKSVLLISGLCFICIQNHKSKPFFFCVSFFFICIHEI